MSRNKIVPKHMVENSFSFKEFFLNVPTRNGDGTRGLFSPGFVKLTLTFDEPTTYPQALACFKSISMSQPATRTRMSFKKASCCYHDNIKACPVHEGVQL